MHDPVTLWCLPNAGASAALYAGWRRHLPAVAGQPPEPALRVALRVALRIAPLELPGRGARAAEPLCEDFGALCDDLEHALTRQLLPGQPYALFGHSMGALLAHELAHRLRDRHPPRALFVAGAAAPALRDPSRFAGPLDDASLLAQMRALGGTPPELLDDPEMMAIALPILRADYRACASYRARAAAPLSCALHAFGGRDDRAVGQAITGWRCESTGPTSVTWYDGGHFFVRDAVPDLLARMARLLADSRVPNAVAPC